MLFGDSRSPSTEVAPRLDTLPKGAIHNDGNDHNILVLDGEMAGLLDFGDMVSSALVCEVANTAAYCILDKRGDRMALSVNG